MVPHASDELLSSSPTARCRAGEGRRVGAHIGVGSGGERHDEEKKEPGHRFGRRLRMWLEQMAPGFARRCQRGGSSSLRGVNLYNRVQVPDVAPGLQQPVGLQQPEAGEPAVGPSLLWPVSSLAALAEPGQLAKARVGRPHCRRLDATKAPL
eukprot:scaffold22313_cov62-Phaeocystis_antarctica.AAC.1